MHSIYKSILLSLVLFVILLSPSYSAEESPLDYFLVLSDIHFDPFSTCKTKPCDLIQQLRQHPATQWSKILSQTKQFPPQFKKNTNYFLLNSALQEASQAAKEQHAQFVLILGDYLGHEYYSQYRKFSIDKSKAGYQAFVRKTNEFLKNELEVAFAGKSVYMAVGNNDSYQGDYAMINNGTFFKEMGALWSDLIIDAKERSSMQEQFVHAGYYAVTLNHPSSLRLIVLNSTYFSSKAKGPGIGEVADKQLNWLHTQLQKAKEKNQQVLIAMHIPEGFDVYATLRTRLFRLITLWKVPYIKRFEAELEEFSATIAGVFAGHLHRDWMQIMSFGDSEVPLIGVTSISPIFGNNPGFKMCAYANGEMQLHDFIDYSYAIYGGTWREKIARSNKKEANLAST